jgi:hypothetical protein
LRRYHERLAHRHSPPPTLRLAQPHDAVVSRAGVRCGADAEAAGGEVHGVREETHEGEEEHMKAADAVVLVMAIVAVTALVMCGRLPQWALVGPFLLVAWRFGVRL